MEKLKDPTMLISLANTAGLVGITAYFYKQNEALRAEIVKLSNTMNAVSKKVIEMEKGTIQKGEVLQSFSSQLKEVNQKLESTPQLENFEDIQYDIEELVNVLRENNIQCDIPSQVMHRPRKVISGSRGGRGRRINTREDYGSRDTRDYGSRDYGSRVHSRDPYGSRDIYGSRDLYEHREEIAHKREEPKDINSQFQINQDVINQVREAQGTHSVR